MRAVWGQAFDLPDANVDFDCPLLPWGADQNQVQMLRMEDGGMTPTIAVGQARAGSCCDPAKVQTNNKTETTWTN